MRVPDWSRYDFKSYVFTNYLERIFIFAFILHDSHEATAYNIFNVVFLNLSVLVNDPADVMLEFWYPDFRLYNLFRLFNIITESGELVKSCIINHRDGCDLSVT